LKRHAKSQLKRSSSNRYRPDAPATTHASSNVVKRKLSGYPVKHAEHQHRMQPTRTPPDAIQIKTPLAA